MPEEEAKDARRTIPAATYLAVAMIAVLYGASAWAMTVAAGPDHIVQAAQGQGPDVVFTLAATHLGHTAGVLGHVLFATSILAAAISFHNTIARYVFALGREHVLPAVFGRTSTSGAPQAGSIAQTVIGLLVIAGFAVSGADPVVNLFYVASTSGALGILLLLFLAGVSVLGFFGADRRGENAWRTRIAPALSLAGLAVMFALVLVFSAEAVCGGVCVVVDRHRLRQRSRDVGLWLCCIPVVSAVRQISDRLGVRVNCTSRSWWFASGAVG